MAKIKLSGFDELEQFLGKLAQPEKMAIKAVNEAAPVLKKSLVSQIKKAADRKDAKGNPYSTGELAESVDVTKARKNEYGVFSVIKPEGTDSKGVRNVEKLAYLEYGVASHGQLPHPVRGPAVSAVETECEEIMRDVICREVDKL